MSAPRSGLDLDLKTYIVRFASLMVSINRKQVSPQKSTFYKLNFQTFEKLVWNRRIEWDLLNQSTDSNQNSVQKRVSLDEKSLFRRTRSLRLNTTY